jgi:general secretion pathway protein D
MVDRLDTRTKQVLIEARLLETSLNPSSIRGLDWSGTLKAQNVRMGNNLNGVEPATGEANSTLSSTFPKLLADSAKGFSPATAFLDADGVSAVFSFLNNNSESKTLSTPRTVTMDNEPAKLSVTREIPIFNTTPSSANTPGSSSITYSNIGVVLDVTPRISANNYVNLKVFPEVSRVSGQDKQTIGGDTYTANIFSVNRMQTTVMIPSGNTLVLGGLAQDDVRNDTTKVPLLGDIPGLGHLFRSSSKSQSKNNLLVFITPTIVVDDDFQETKTKFMKTRLAHQQDIDPKNSILDSQNPYDWSQLGSTQKKAATPEED